MNIDHQRIKALNVCIAIAKDYTEDEINRFMPPVIHIAWQIGNEYLAHATKEEKKKLQNFSI